MQLLKLIAAACLSVEILPAAIITSGTVTEVTDSPTSGFYGPYLLNLDDGAQITGGIQDSDYPVVGPGCFDAGCTAVVPLSRANNDLRNPFTSGNLFVTFTGNSSFTSTGILRGPFSTNGMPIPGTCPFPEADPTTCLISISGTGNVKYTVGTYLYPNDTLPPVSYISSITYTFAAPEPSTAVLLLFPLACFRLIYRRTRNV